MGVGSAAKGASHSSNSSTSLSFVRDVRFFSFCSSSSPPTLTPTSCTRERTRTRFQSERIGE